MTKLKPLIIKYCEYLIQKIDPGYEFPKERINYKSIVTAINGQTTTGKLAFFKTLSLNLDFQDRTMLKELLELKNKATYTE